MKTGIITILVNIALIAGYMIWYLRHKPEWTHAEDGLVYLVCLFCGHILWSLVAGIFARIIGYERIAKVFFISAAVPFVIGALIGAIMDA
jgi:signal transduction histidine kinase